MRAGVGVSRAKLSNSFPLMDSLGSSVNFERWTDSFERASTPNDGPSIGKRQKERRAFVFQISFPAISLFFSLSLSLAFYLRAVTVFEHSSRLVLFLTDRMERVGMEWKS